MCVYGAFLIQLFVSYCPQDSTSLMSLLLSSFSTEVAPREGVEEWLEASPPPIPSLHLLVLLPGVTVGSQLWLDLGAASGDCFGSGAKSSIAGGAPFPAVCDIALATFIVLPK